MSLLALVTQSDDGRKYDGFELIPDWEIVEVVMRGDYNAPKTLAVLYVLIAAFFIYMFWVACTYYGMLNAACDHKTTGEGDILPNQPSNPLLRTLLVFVGLVVGGYFMFMPLGYIFYYLGVAFPPLPALGIPLWFIILGQSHRAGRPGTPDVVFGHIGQVICGIALIAYVGLFYKYSTSYLENFINAKYSLG